MLAHVIAHPCLFTSHSARAQRTASPYCQSDCDSREVHAALISSHFHRLLVLQATVHRRSTSTYSSVRIFDIYTCTSRRRRANFSAYSMCPGCKEFFFMQLQRRRRGARARPRARAMRTGLAHVSFKKTPLLISLW